MTGTRLGLILSEQTVGVTVTDEGRVEAEVVAVRIQVTVLKAIVWVRVEGVFYEPVGAKLSFR